MAGSCSSGLGVVASSGGVTDTAENESDACANRFCARARRAAMSASAASRRRCSRRSRRVGPCPRNITIPFGRPPGTDVVEDQGRNQGDMNVIGNQLWSTNIAANTVTRLDITG